MPKRKNMIKQIEKASEDFSNVILIVFIVALGLFAYSVVNTVPEIITTTLTASGWFSYPLSMDLGTWILLPQIHYLIYSGMVNPVEAVILKFADAFLGNWILSKMWVQYVLANYSSLLAL